MALIFDGFLPVTKRKRERNVFHRPLFPLRSSRLPSRRFCSRGASRRTRDATAECGSFAVCLVVRNRKRGTRDERALRSPRSRSTMFNPAVNATFERAISRSR